MLDIFLKPHNNEQNSISQAAHIVVTAGREAGEVGHL